MQNVTKYKTSPRGEKKEEEHEQTVDYRPAGRAEPRADKCPRENERCADGQNRAEFRHPPSGASGLRE